MTTDPICIVTEAIPEGWFLVEAKNITPTVRNAKIPFRIARKPPPKGHHPVPVGVILREEDRAAWDAVNAKAIARREREAKYANPLTRH